MGSTLSPSGNAPVNDPFSIEFVPLRKFRGRRNGYLFENKVYVCPVLHQYLIHPKTRHLEMARLPILDIDTYFSGPAADKLKGYILAEYPAANQ